jgi:hypothetical protein
METTTVVLPRPRSRASSLALRQTVTMTAGADAPLRALREAPTASQISCHPCDEAIVRHLLGHIGRVDVNLQTDADVTPGVLAIAVRFAVAS